MPDPVARGAVFFDIDGTLVPGTSSGAFLAERLGHIAKLEAVEAAYERGEATNDEVCDIDAAGWAGYSEATIRDWLVELPVIDGIPPVLEWCRRHDLVPILATLAWRPVAESLAERFGFLVSGGPELHVDQGCYTGRVKRYFDEADKRDDALALAAHYGVGANRSTAIGDSRSDLLLFDAVASGIALNASVMLDCRADVSIRTDDLRDVLPDLARLNERLA